MNWQVVSLSGVQPQAWKNGGGTTRELLAWPSATDWQVRLSVAEVKADGPFSRFDGVQRCFAVLSGAGVRLVVNQQAHVLTPASDPLAFDGGADTQCTLLGGATQDFNLMVRGGDAVLQRVQTPMLLAAAPAFLQAVYAVSAPAQLGPLTLPPHTLAWRLGGPAIAVQGSDALWMEVSE
jgi:environmental stress-induced protein Ves